MRSKITLTEIRAVRTEIEKMANDLMWVDYTTDYILEQNGNEILCKEMKSFDAYMKAFEMSANGDVRCYINTLGRKACSPIFAVIDGVITLSGLTINPIYEEENKMKVTREQLIDYICNNFTIKGRKISKKTLNQHSTEYLENIIEKNHCWKSLEEWINKPKLIKFIADGIKDGMSCSWDCCYSSEEECRKNLENEGVKVIKIATKSNHHRCKYCGSIASGKATDILCDECREIFGHAYYSEL